MKKMALRTIALNVWLVSMVMANQDQSPSNQRQNGPAHVASSAQEYDAFDAYMETAFDQGVLDKPIVMKKPSFAKRMLTRFGLPIAMRLISFKHAVHRWWYGKRAPRVRSKA